MTTFQIFDNAAQFPSADFIRKKAGGPAPVFIYQPYIAEGDRDGLHEQALPFNIAFNTGAETREYELFRALHAHHRQAVPDIDIFWGLVSSKFELKAASTFSSLLHEADSARADGADCYAYNPMIGLAAIYSNVWEQALMGGHPGMQTIFQHLAARGVPVAAPQSNAAFFFCNYICGNERFWSGYFQFCEHILGDLEDQARQGTDAGQAYSGSASYGRDSNAKMRPFVIERLLGTYLVEASDLGLKLAFHQPTLDDFEWKFGTRLGGLLHHLLGLKDEFLATNDAAALDAWQKARRPLILKPHLIWQMDDPPGWMPRGTAR
ncbi:hypothetical protein [Rhizobium tubonense]|uniref:Uncharacterized protein n=1 Tax=Rhizobium tubonense TaxID=484088 RepID=A0A2W4C2W7_9HYPH|nr:hypothetical protein [Rhizobium tubonense]PZM07411.1 hypothetical protein CPY51_31610 [Rhizobium tubonense]